MKRTFKSARKKADQRKIDGKVFKRKSKGLTKSSAKKKAELLRKRGIYVRVIQGKKGSEIYVNESKPKKRIEQKKIKKGIKAVNARLQDFLTAKNKKVINELLKRGLKEGHSGRVDYNLKKTEGGYILTMIGKVANNVNINQEGYTNPNSVKGQYFTNKGIKFHRRIMKITV